MSSTGPESIPPPIEPTPTPAPPPAAERQYEFTTNDNALIGDLARKMWFLGLVAVPLGLLGFMSSALARDFGESLYALLYLVLGIWTLNASQAFRGIVETQGSDIRHLMVALASLRKIYTVLFWLTLIVLVLAMVMLVMLAVGRFGSMT